MIGLLEKHVVPRLEKILLVFLIGVAAFFFIYAYLNYTPNPRRFPLMTSGFVVFTGLIILFWNYMPARIQAWEAESALDAISDDLVEEQLGKAGQALEGEAQQPESEETEIQYGKYGILPLHYHVGIISILYGVIGSLVGLLYLTPIMVFAYGRVARLSWPVTIFLVIVSLAVCYGFMDVLNAPIHRGLLHRMGYL